MNLPELVELTEDQVLAALDPKDEASILTYGASIQTVGSTLSNSVLDKTRVKDTGEIGKTLLDLSSNMKRLDYSKASPDKRRSLSDVIFRRAQPFLQFLDQYESVADAVDEVEKALMQHRLRLHEDAEYLVEVSDILTIVVEQLSVHITVLEMVIESGYERLKHIADDERETRKTTAAIEMMEQRLTDLSIARTFNIQNTIVTEQLLSANRMTIQKIQSQIMNGIPMWKQQIAIFITTYRLAESTDISKMVSDFQNETMLATSKLLGTTVVNAAKERNRTVIDIKTLKQVNDDIIAAIDNVRVVMDEGKAAREEIKGQLIELETKLKSKVLR